MKTLNTQIENVRKSADVSNAQQIKLYFSNRFVKIPVDMIVRLEADCNYTTVYTKTQKFTSAKTLGLYEEMLDKQHFMRVHKKHIVNVKHVVEFEVQHNNANVRLYDGELVEVSRRRVKDVVQKIETYKY